ncbi:phage terminase small subunit [Brevundimonas sp.]|uniref:phage terminase small subunit n=1 Tax=Brevundimonas sp. TaxID=1871086 RepID=UPI00289AC283|nr:phage terminase small subunit [Brevundimonas sp.]
MSPAEHAKAKAEAKAREKAEAEAEAKAAILNRRRPLMTAPVVRPDIRAEKPVPPPQPGRTSPAARRRAYLVASGAGAVLAASGLSADVSPMDDISLSPDVAKIVIQLEDDRRRLKDIKATDRKVEAKRLMLPAYKGWCDGVLAAGAGERGPLDQVFTTIMAWTIDVGDYMTALPMLEHTMIHGLDMPAQFNRDPITFAIDQICEEAIRLYDLGLAKDAGFDAAVLPMLQDLVADHDVDLHDEVEAKLHKAMGRAVLAEANEEDAADLKARQETALREYLAAIEKCPRVGVKKDIERLQRALTKAGAETANEDQTSTENTASQDA